MKAKKHRHRFVMEMCDCDHCCGHEICRCGLTREEYDELQENKKKAF